MVKRGVAGKRSPKVLADEWLPDWKMRLEAIVRRGIPVRRLEYPGVFDGFFKVRRRVP